MGGVAIPRPENGKWLPAGEIVADDYSIAWRTYDAQYWGVPQRRKRIYIVADFTGRRAGHIQFERESLCGNFAQGSGEGQRTAGSPAGDAGTPGEGVDLYNGRLTWEIATSITASIGAIVPKATVYGLSAKDSNAWKSSNPHSGCYEAEATRTLDTHGGNPTCAQGGNIIVQEARVFENHGQDSRCRELGDIGETVAAKYGTGGNNTPIVVEGKPYSIGNGQVHDLGLDEKAKTLSCMHDQQAIITAQEEHGYPYRARRLTPLECSRLQGYPDWWVAGLDEPEPTEEEVDAWAAIFETHRKIIAPNIKPKTRNQVRKWLKHPQSDSAEYRMWGNSLAIPCAYTVLAGIAEALTESERSGKIEPRATKGTREQGAGTGGGDMDEITMMPTRRCKRCGRLLFSKEALEKGYGCQCAKHVRQEELERQPIDGQMNLMDFFKTESEE